MRYYVRISVHNLKLTSSKSKKLISSIQELKNLEGIIIKTGSEFDSYIENEGNDSKIFFTEIEFYVDGNLETTELFANRVANLIQWKLKITENELHFEITNSQKIGFYG
jgi:hypothetical protein